MGSPSDKGRKKKEEKKNKKEKNTSERWASGACCAWSRNTKRFRAEAARNAAKSRANKD